MWFNRICWAIEDIERWLLKQLFFIHLTFHWLKCRHRQSPPIASSNLKLISKWNYIVQLHFKAPHCRGSCANTHSVYRFVFSRKPFRHPDVRQLESSLLRLAGTESRNCDNRSVESWAPVGEWKSSQKLPIHCFPRLEAETFGITWRQCRRSRLPFMQSAAVLLSLSLQPAQCCKRRGLLI